MEQVKEVFAREYDTVLLPDLKTGIGGTFPAGLQFVRDQSFVEAVAVAAKRSVVCNQSSVRAFLYHLPNLLHQIAERVCRACQLNTQTQIVLHGDAETGVVAVGRYGRITPAMWLGAELQTAETELPPAPTPRSSPFVRAATLAVQLAQLRGYVVDMDSTANTTGCFVDVGSRSGHPIVKVRVKESNANHAAGGTGKKLLVFTEMAGGAVVTQVQVQTGSVWKVRGKGRVLPGGVGVDKMQELCSLVKNNGMATAGVWAQEEKRFRARAAELKAERERAATEAAAAAAATAPAAAATATAATTAATAATATTTTATSTTTATTTATTAATVTATAAAATVAAAEVDECPVCQDPYGTGGSAPVVLSCTHAICNVCLPQLQAGVCPLCRTGIFPPPPPADPAPELTHQLVQQLSNG